ncbi:thiamine pyrophosphokinase 1-like [Brevipalpus obovatus]|uniref:thiamine pyrophosphokinase 1-like n=1 Tax=Brevipalpus obovatus TaxID=246614 RepID=UPI003D9FA968
MVSEICLIELGFIFTKSRNGHSENFTDRRNREGQRKKERPDIISGDFDSIRKECPDFFEQNYNVQIISTPDQDEPDFAKALKQIPIKDGQNFKYVIVFWQQTPRLDQTFSVIHFLHTWNMYHCGFPVFLVNLRGSVSWLLSKGDHLIRTSMNSRWCSILPFNKECKVTSSGLQYEMDHLNLSFNSIIRTSNSFDPSAKRVKLRLDESALWSQELHLASFN